jgi:molecular chaperone GrpE
MSELNQNTTADEPLQSQVTTPEAVEDSASEPQSDEVPENASVQVIEELRTALAQSESREKDIQDKHLRLHAEFDNYRRRTAKEHLELIETANGKLLGKLSEVLDNFDRAFAVENKGTVESFEKGMTMIYDQFKKVLSDSGLEVLNPVGEEFDPNCQEAFMRQASETIPENHVVTVFQKGYKLKNKILKTAKVIVSAGK